MKVVYDSEKLKGLLTAFYGLTKIAVTLFDPEMNCIADAGEWQSYCLAIGEDPKLLAKCRCCDRENALIALKQKQTHMYTCHAGIAEAVTPIYFEDTLTGYLVIGKFRDAERIYTSEEMVIDTAEKYGLDREKMLAMYNQLPVIQKNDVDASVQILKTIAGYIANERFIRFDRNMLSIEIERYIEEHLGDKLSAEVLCKRFCIGHHDLCELFKNNFNDTPQAYIGKKRLQRAKQLLGSTDKSVRKISEEIGLSDYSYFIQAFKKQTGLSPLRYRKSLKK